MVKSPRALFPPEDLSPTEPNEPGLTPHRLVAMNLEIHFSATLGTLSWNTLQKILKCKKQ